MTASGPPAYAWDWFARQRLLWRETRARLVRASAPAAARYAAITTRAEVVTLLRADYRHDPVVRATVDRVVGDVAFLGHTDMSFERLGAANAPRGMRWWWTALTGEEVGAPRPSASAATAARTPQPTLDDILGGYGDPSPDEDRPAEVPVDRTAGLRDED